MLEQNLSGVRREAPGRCRRENVLGAVSEAGSGSIVSKRHLSLYSSGLGSWLTHLAPPKSRRLTGPWSEPRAFYLYTLFFN